MVNEKTYLQKQVEEVRKDRADIYDISDCLDAFENFNLWDEYCGKLAVFANNNEQDVEELDDTILKNFTIEDIEELDNTFSTNEDTEQLDDTFTNDDVEKRGEKKDALSSTAGEDCKSRAEPGSSSPTSRKFTFNADAVEFVQRLDETGAMGCR